MAVGGPEDDFAVVKTILARQRRLGQPFEVAWGRALEAIPPMTDADRHQQATIDRGCTLSALSATEGAWRAGYLRQTWKPPPKPRFTLEELRASVASSGMLTGKRQSGGQQRGTSKKRRTGKGTASATRTRSVGVGA